MNLRSVLPPVIVAVLGLGALSSVQDTGFREGIEADLTERAQSALAAADLRGVDVEVTGRDADVTASSDYDAITAAEVVNGVAGVRTAVAYGPNGPASAGNLTIDAYILPRDPEPTESEDTTSKDTTVDVSAEATPSPEATDPSSDGASAEPEEDEPERNPTREEREQAQEDLVEIPNITFVTDSAELTEDGRRVVRNAAEVLEEHPEVEVRIEGHTDSLGTRVHNWRLSERRAQEVLDRLVGLGVDEDRLTAKGYGESDPLVVPKTFADLEKNRRVEFIVRN
ncbi:OmpA family protein [Promicromonospora sp. NPDC023805]|uniref:OmpA family protein n=1 Tax=Promicromonospora sp. NPDC023805 TaxID=3154696 RepID=UPI0033DD02EF